MDTGNVSLSDIQRFYRNSTVFLTCGTKFLGRLLLEKILRALPVKKVYVLVRLKEGETDPKNRNVFESPIFDVLKRSNPEALQKVELIAGDCGAPNLGLSSGAVEKLVREVNVVFHGTVPVGPDERIKRAAMINVRATRDLIDLTRRFENTVKAFVYVSSAFSNSNQTEISEQVYPAKIAAEDLIRACESLDDDCLDQITKTLIGDWPNTDTFTRQVAEDFIKRQANVFPVSIVRPTIVTSTAEEPVAAYVDDVFNWAGLVMANTMGICRISYYKNNNLDVVPADHVVNIVIASGWHSAETYKKEKSEATVYQLSSAIDNPISQDNAYGLLDYNCRQNPCQTMVSYPLYFRTTCKYNYLFLRYLLHTVVAYFVDALRVIKGEGPVLVEGMKKLHNVQEGYEHFTINSFYVHSDNAQKLLKRMTFQDRTLFNFDIRTVDWEAYFAQYAKGIRVYLAKETANTLESGRQRYASLRKSMIITLTVMTVVLYATIKLLLLKVVPFVFGVVLYGLRNLIC